MDEYLAGGQKGYYNHDGQGLEAYCRNLTSDPTTGLARRTDEDVKRVLRSGVLPEGRQSYWRRMPWAFFSNWTEEDRHAVLVYLRHVKAVKHTIEDPEPGKVTHDPQATEELYGGDYAGH